MRTKKTKKKSDLVSPRRFELSVAKRWREREREREKLSWKEWECWAIITLGYMLIDKKLRLQVSDDTSTTSSSHCIWFCTFFIIWILFIPLPCSKLHHLLRLFCSLANDEIIGYRLRSSSEGKTMKSIHVCAHEGERLIWVKYLMSNFSIIVVSECSSNFMK